MKRYTKEDYSKFWDACVNNDIPTITDYINSGIDINKQDRKGNTILMVTIDSLNLEAAKILVESGADLNIKNSAGKTAIEAAIKRSKDMTKLLIDYGADLDTINNDGLTLLMVLINRRTYQSEGVFQLLVDSGIDIDAQGFNGNTALLVAVEKNDYTFTELLLNAGADPNIKNSDGNTALSLSLVNDRAMNISELLIKYGADIDTQNNDGVPPIGIVSRGGNIIAVKMLIAAGANLDTQDGDGDTALIRAAYYGKMGIVKLLIDSGANPSIQNKHGKTYEDYLNKKKSSKKYSTEFTEKDYTAVWEACRYNDIKTIEEYIDSGMDIDRIRSWYYSTILMESIDRQNLSLVKLLISASNNLNLQDLDGKTALVYAVIKRNIKIVQLLIDSGANLDIQDNKGRTALMWSAIEGCKDIAKVLLNAGANSNIESNRHKTYEDYLLSFKTKRVSAESKRGYKMRNKSIDLPGSNLQISGVGYDRNGNWTISLSFYDSKGFSIQTNGVLYETDRITRRNRKSLNELSEEDLRTIRDEVVNYIVEYGTKREKALLWTPETDEYKKESGKKVASYIDFDRHYISELCYGPFEDFAEFINSLKPADLNRLTNDYIHFSILACVIDADSYAHTVNKAQYIIDRGASVNTKFGANKDITPLERAVLGGSVDMLKLILKYGGYRDINTPDSFGNTPLMNAVRANMREENKILKIKLLLQYGANDSGVNNKGRTVYDEADYVGAPEIKSLLHSFKKPHRAPSYAVNASEIKRRVSRMYKKSDYNGWTNYETWNVHLWATNEEGIYDEIAEYPEPFTADTAEDLMYDIFPKGTPDMDRGVKDMTKVNWQEIANAFNEIRGEDEEEDEDMEFESKKRYSKYTKVTPNNLKVGDTVVTNIDIEPRYYDYPKGKNLDIVPANTPVIVTSIAPKVSMVKGPEFDGYADFINAKTEDGIEIATNFKNVRFPNNKESKRKFSGKAWVRQLTRQDVSRSSTLDKSDIGLWTVWANGALLASYKTRKEAEDLAISLNKDDIYIPYTPYSERFKGVRRKFSAEYEDDEFIDENDNEFIEDEEEFDEPSPDDIIISGGRNNTYNVGSEDEGFMGEFDSYDEAESFIRRWMKKNKFYPDVWVMSDHGNLERITIEPLENVPPPKYTYSDVRNSYFWIKGSEGDSFIAIDEADTEDPAYSYDISTGWRYRIIDAWGGDTADIYWGDRVINESEIGAKLTPEEEYQYVYGKESSRKFSKEKGVPIYTVDIRGFDSDGEEYNIDSWPTFNIYYDEDEAINALTKYLRDSVNDEDYKEGTVYYGEKEYPNGDIYGEPYDAFTGCNRSKGEVDRAQYGYVSTDLDYYAGDYVPKESKRRYSRKFTKKEYSDFVEACGFKQNVELVKKYIKLGVDVNMMDSHGYLPLHEAAAHGTVEIIQILLSAGADINKQDSHGRTAIFNSAIFGKYNVCQLLIDKRANLDIIDSGGQTVLGNMAYFGSVKMTKFLLDAGANPNAQNKIGKPIIMKVLDKHEETADQVIKILLDGGADPNAQDKKGNTALMLCSTAKEARILLDAGADPNIQNSGGVTALMTAAYFGKDKIIPVLLNYDADPGIMSNEGKTYKDYKDHFNNKYR